METETTPRPAAQIAALVDTAKTNRCGATGSGRAWRRATRYINSHRVQANVFGSDDVQIWVDGSAEPLSVAQAAERIAA